MEHLPPRLWPCPQAAQHSTWRRRRLPQEKRLLPGPYTFILEGTKLVPKIMLTKRKTVGIRVPDNRICLAIVRTLGRPVISTSAGIDEPYAIQEAHPSQIDVVIDGGTVKPSPSSVISLIGDVPEVIREGKGDVNNFY